MDETFSDVFDSSYDLFLDLLTLLCRNASDDVGFDAPEVISLGKCDFRIVFLFSSDEVFFSQESVLL